MKLLLPPEIPSQIEEPVVFLAGPIQGARDWQREAVTHFKECPLIIASPRRPRWEKSREQAEYPRQVDWESHMLKLAAKSGVIMFYLAREEEKIEGRAFAQTTRFELAEWVSRSRYEPVKIVVGLEEGFSGAKYLRHRLPQDYPQVHLVEGLEDTCQQAVALLDF